MYNRESVFGCSPFTFAGQSAWIVLFLFGGTTMKEEKIKVLALIPMELPKEIELDNTLEAMQKFVGGLIECITLCDTGSEVTLVCNDEGKLLGLPLNRPLWDGADVLAGPGFLAGCDNEGNLTSLPQSAMDFYKEKFRAFIIEI